MKFKLLFFLILSYNSFSQERKKVASDVFLIENYVVDNFEQPEAILYSVLLHQEYSGFGDRLIRRFKKHIKKFDLKSTYNIHIFESITEIENFQKTYKDRYVALIFFGNKHNVIPDNSGDPEKRRIGYDVYFELHDNLEDKILFKKRFDVYSTYYVRNENSLAKALVSELVNTIKK